MRMFTVRLSFSISSYLESSLTFESGSTYNKIPNQSSIPMAWKCFTASDRLLPSSNRDRLVDVCEELIKTTLILQPHFDLFGDRYSEREEKRQHGKLRTQQETEEAKKKVQQEEEEEKRKKEQEQSANAPDKILSNM